MHVLVTGATGFIGSHLVPALRSAGHDVTAVGRTDPGWSGVAWCRADLADRPPAALLPAADAIVHLAQSAHHRAFPNGVPDLFAVNVAATADLLEHARKCGARAFVFASSGSVYGARRGILHEDATTPSPTSYYAGTKLAAEALLPAYAGHFAACALRLFTPYGPGQAGRLVPELIQRIREGRSIALTGSEGLRLAPTFVGDIARVFVAALVEGWEGAVNVAPSARVSLCDLAEAIGAALGREPRFEAAAGLAPPDAVPDLGRLRARVDPEAFLPLAEGLRRTISAGC